MAQVKGIKKVLTNLNKVIKTTKKATKKGLIMVGLEIKRVSMQNVPIDLGNLRASHYVAWRGNSDPLIAFQPDPIDANKMILLKTQHQLLISQATSKLTENQVEVGVSAFYAVIQHENREFKHRVGGPFFLQNAVSAVTLKAEKIIGTAAMIDGG